MVLRLFLPLLLIAVSVGVSGQTQSPTVSLRQGPVATDPNLPPVYATVDRKRVPLGEQVTFTVSPARVVNDRRYVLTLYFGDGEQQAMRSSQVAHLYREVGTYTYSLSLKQSQPPGGNGKDNNALPRVNLTVSPVASQQDEPVAFIAQLNQTVPAVQYRFVYGDGSSSGWQTNPRAEHSFSRAGNYSAYVDIRDNKQRLGGSSRQSVAVGPPLQVSVTARPVQAQSGKPVSFIASVSTARAGTRYLFNFGDGAQSSWQDAARAQHSYKNGGRYSASVQVSQSDNNRTFTATSIPTLVTVQQQPTPPADSGPTSSSTPASNSGPTPTPATSPSGSPAPNGSPSPGGSSSHDPSSFGPAGSTSPTNPTASPTSSNLTNPSWFSPRTWLYLLIAALLLLLIYQATGYLFAARPTFEPFSDPGMATIANRKGLPIDFQILLNPNVSAGDSSVATDAPRLISNADQLDDRQIIEI